MINTDRISGIVLLALSVLVWREAGEYGKLAALFPRVVISIIAFLSLALIFKSFVMPERRYFFHEVKVKYIVFTILMAMGWIALIPFLGFITTSVIFFTILVIILSEKKTPKMAAQSIVIVIVMVCLFYLLFHKVLLVPLPTGIFI